MQKNIFYVPILVMTLPISVLILTQNSESTLERTLKSVQDFSEVVVIDGGSHDRTQEICASFSNVTFRANPWQGFATQRNFALGMAKHEWCLVVDSDEAVTPELVKALRVFDFTKPSLIVGKIFREEFFAGQRLRNCFGTGSFQERLVARQHVTYVGEVHEEVRDKNGQPVRPPQFQFLPQEAMLLHDENYDFEAWLRKYPRYTLLTAQKKMKQGKRVTLLELLLTPFFTFLKIYGKSYRMGYLAFIIAGMEVLNQLGIKLTLFTWQQKGKNET